MSQAAALAALRQRADERAREDRFSGALLIARHGKVLLEKTWGLADREAGKPATDRLTCFYALRMPLSR